MNQWYVKDLSKLTQVSVQTLHHYDRIDLLKPSVRLPNGYRLYSEKDLLKLQQIIALKFFGFELSQIKALLQNEVDMIEHFCVQSQLLETKANTLFEASQTLKNITAEYSQHQSIPWKTLIKLIEVYHMTQQLEKTWAGKALTATELKEYAQFEQELKNRTENEKNAFRQIWTEIVNGVNAYVDKDPASDIGKALGKRCMDAVNAYYGKNHVTLRNAIWEKGFKMGEIADPEYALSPQSYAWLDNAITAYYRSRIMDILNQVETTSHSVLNQQWEILLVDMHGDAQEPKNAIFKVILEDANMSQAAKNWLQAYIRSQ